MDLRQRNVGKYTKAPAGEQVIPRADVTTPHLMDALGNAVLDVIEYDPNKQQAKIVKIAR